MDTQGIFITCHAMLRYAQRVESRLIDKEYTFSAAEIGKYCRTIRSHIERGACLPTICCQLFVKPDRSNHSSAKRVLRALANNAPDSSAAETGWGSYVYDEQAEICIIIEDGVVKTVIAPNEEQLVTLEEQLERIKQNALPPAPQPTPPPMDLDQPDPDQQMADVFSSAFQLNEKRRLNSADSAPAPVYVELLHPDRVPKHDRATPKFVAMFLRWIGRVVPGTAGTRVLLLLDPYYRFFRRYVALLQVGGLDVHYLPEHQGSGIANKPRGQLQNYDQLRELISTRGSKYGYVFILGTHASTLRVLQLIHQHIGCVSECTRSSLQSWMLDGDTVFAVDIDNPDQTGNVSRFQP
jgi:hypothetical protein